MLAFLSLVSSWLEGTWRRDLWLCCEFLFPQLQVSFCFFSLKWNRRLPSFPLLSDEGVCQEGNKAIRVMPKDGPQPSYILGEPQDLPMTSNHEDGIEMKREKKKKKKAPALDSKTKNFAFFFFLQNKKITVEQFPPMLFYLCNKRTTLNNEQPPFTVGN